MDQSEAEPFLGPVHDRLARFDPKQLRGGTRILAIALRVLYAVVRDVANGRLMLHATGLVYTTILSLVPLLALSFSVLKGFGAHNRMEPVLREMLEPLGPQAGEVVNRLMGFVDNMQLRVLGAVGLAVLVYTVIALIQKIEAAFNSIWQVGSTRSMSRRFADYLSVLLIGPLLLFSATGIYASLMSTQVVERLLATQPFGLLFAIASALLPYLMIAGVLSFMYIFLPNTQVRPAAGMIGGAVGGILWVLGGWAFTSFIASSASYMAIYSAFAAIILFLLWLNFSWTFVLVGASVSFYVQHPEQTIQEPAPGLPLPRAQEYVALAAATGIADAFIAGAPPPTAAELATLLGVGENLVQMQINRLADANLVRVIGDDPPGYVPARPLNTIPVEAVLSSVRGADPGVAETTPGASLTEVVHHLEDRMEDAMVRAVEGETLADLAADMVARRAVDSDGDGGGDGDTIPPSVTQVPTG